MYSILFPLDSIFSIYSIKLSNGLGFYKDDTIYINFQDSTFKHKDKVFRFYYEMRNKRIYVSGRDIALMIYRLTSTPIFFDYKSNEFFRALETIKRFQFFESNDSCVLNFTLVKNLKEQVWVEENFILVHLPEGFYPKFNFIKGDSGIVDSIVIFHTKEGVFFKIFISNKYGSYRKYKEENVLKFIIYSYANFGYIVIDPGHGGKDPGAIGKWGIKEKDITLAISKKVANILRREYGFKVILTRDSDIFLSLSERAEIAKRYNAKIFVSIHCNYFDMDNASGPETYFLSTARTSEERAVETLENSVIKYEVEESDVLKYIVSDILQNIYLKESQKLAFFIHQKLSRGRKDRGVRQAGFYVLRMVYAPSVLVEVGYISNPEEAKLLIDDNYQNKLARDIAQGIIEYVNWYLRR
ncbi:MAG: N-acetylmuramoyl-L-alanine amidase [candidate division WOR-3 bacterium]